MAELLSETVKDSGDKVFEKPGGVIVFNIDASNVEVDQQTAQKVRETIVAGHAKAPAFVTTEEQVSKRAIAACKTQAVKSAGVNRCGSEILFGIRTDNVEVVKGVCKTAITLGALYAGYKLMRPVVEAAVKKAFGGERDDQEIKDIKHGSLHVPIDCSTDERFLEVLTEYESGKTKENVQETFLQVGMKAEELKVGIENEAEVNENKKVIKKRLSVKRNICKDVKNIAIDDAESDVKKKMENLKSTNESLSESKRKKDQQELTVSQLSHPVQLTGRKIITMGGMNADHNVLSSVTTFSFPDRTYADLPPMNYPRYEAASCCVKNDHVTIAGGLSDESHGLNSIEILKINQHPLQWTISDDILPFKLSSHVLLVHQENLLLIGGYNWDRREISNEIYELPLTSPYTPTLLARMPQGRYMHRAEIVNGSLFILGGRSTTNSEDRLDSVIRYDPTSNGFIECASLPRPVSGMSTVTWRNKIIVIGGEDINGRALNDVIMYDTESGQRDSLPSLNHKRSGHSAVIINNAIVVLEGRNKERYLSSGEIFSWGTGQWRCLRCQKKDMVQQPW